MVVRITATWCFVVVIPLLSTSELEDVRRFLDARSRARVARQLDRTFVPGGTLSLRVSWTAIAAAFEQSRAGWLLNMGRQVRQIFCTTRTPTWWLLSTSSITLAPERLSRDTGSVEAEATARSM